MLNIINETHIKTITIYYCIPIKMSKIKKTDHTKCWRGCGTTGRPVPCWWERKTAQPFGKPVWQFLRMLTVYWLYDSPKIYIQSSFTYNSPKQPKCPFQVSGQTNCAACSHTESYSAVRRSSTADVGNSMDGPQNNGAEWKKPDPPPPTQRVHIVWFSLYEIAGNWNLSTVTRRRSGVDWGAGRSTRNKGLTGVFTSKCTELCTSDMCRPLMLVIPQQSSWKCQ